MTGSTAAGGAGSGARAVRVFWFGMHKVLVETEFRLLQDMGYEVFRPPYRSPLVDQSASQSRDHGNSTLAADVHRELSSHDFFSNPITPRIGELLNAHFDAIVVTIAPHWLKSALKAFKATVIFRCYGQIEPLSLALAHNGSGRLIEGRDNFHFLPHAQETLDDEEPWLAARATVVPYWLSGDVLTRREAWRQSAATRRPSVALACPNITHAYYGAHFKYLKRYFEERCFRYYGVQLVPNADLNVVGTLPRDEQLGSMAEESGFLYTYRERDVCYLPPIEMMLMGGPVLYLSGSLLDRYGDGTGPGRVVDEAAAGVQAKRLIRGDAALADDIIESQAAVAYRYTPQHGEPTFRRAFERILSPRPAPPAPLPESRPCTTQRVLLIAHLGGYFERDGQYGAIHGIARVMRQFVRALTDRGVAVSVTYAGADRREIHGFYAASCKDPALLETLAMARVAAMPAQALRDRYSYAVVAHYHLFPEANEFPLPLLAYVPDYLPHFFEGRGWFVENPSDIECGRRLCATARRVLTNSAFSERYLPQSRLQVPADRIAVIPLPYLGRAGSQTGAPPPSAVAEELACEPYIFYPTQPHPNKRLDLLVLAWLLVNRHRSAPVRLVLTAGALPSQLLALVDAASMQRYLHLLPAIADETVEWLYSNARCLSFSSELEGNFPTQVLEALRLECPVVCTDNPLIVSELGELARFLQVAPFGDVAAFARRIDHCVDHRPAALKQQRLVSQRILQKFSYEDFGDRVSQLHRFMSSQEKEDD